MWAVRMGKLLEYLTGRGLLFGLLWAGLACLSVALAALLWTRWGRSQPLRKCLALSLLAHLLFAIYSTTIEIFVGATLPAEEPGIQVHLVGEDSQAQTPSQITGAGSTPIWEQLVGEKAPVLLQEPDRQPPSLPQAQRSVEVQRFLSELRMPLVPAKPQPDASVARLTPPPIQADTAGQRIRPPQPPEPVSVPPPMQNQPAPHPLPLEGLFLQASPRPGLGNPERLPAPGAPAGLLEIHLPKPPNPQLPLGSSAPSSVPPPKVVPELRTDSPGLDSAGFGPADRWLPQASARPSPAFDPSIPGNPSGAHPVGASGIAKPPPFLNPPAPPGPGELPKLYQARTAPDRQQWAAQHGATEQTEKAVQAALAWLAANQEPDGRWDAARHGAGRELFVGGRDRQGSGAQAHTATTGLALLAFLGRGYTHQQGQYQKTLAQGLDYLLRNQAPDGHLGGQADFYAFMYCHGIATLALSEAYGMTQDVRLREPLRQAITYSLAAQHPEQGGWRYRPREPGDTSQLGWQLMALKSAELAGLGIPHAAKQGAWRFLQSVSSGRQGGLAAYRALETPSPAMTAEALLCRLFLGQPPTDPACQEAAQYLLQHLPGQSEANLYYWYYGTLAMFQMGGPYWKSWNEALQKTLLPRQQTTGPLAGSWNPDTRWDNYGGRVYATALSALCLEVYYRYLPLYVHAAEGALGPGDSANR